MVLKPNKPPANYQKPYPFHYDPSAQSIKHFRQRVSQFKNNSTLRCYWMPGQDHFNNTYYFSDRTSISYKPTTKWPVHATPLRLPKVVNVYLVFPIYSETDDGGRTDLWVDTRNQLNTFFNDYVGMFVCEDAGTITPGDGGGSNFRWLQYLCPRREDIIDSNMDKFLGSDHLHIVIYNDLGFATGLGGNPTLLDGTIPTDYFSFYSGYNIDRLPIFRTTGTAATLGQQAYDNDVQALKNAFPSFVRSKTLVYFNSTLPSGSEKRPFKIETPDQHELGVVDGIESRLMQDTWYVNGGKITFPRGWTNVPIELFNQIQQRLSMDGFEVPPLPTYLVGSDAGPRNYFWDLTSDDIWSDISAQQVSWLNQVCTDLTDYGWEYKGTVDTESGFTTIKQAIIDYFQLTDDDKKS